jgi:RND family efflux transporter MFP subunit
MNDELRDRLASLRIDRADEAEPPRGRRALLAGAVLVAAAAAGAFWLLRERPVEVRTAAVESAPAGATGASAVLNASGYVTARRQATVSSKVTGKVVEVLVEEGMAVEEGQVLARLDDAQARLALSLAQAQLAAAGKSLAETEARRREAELRRDRVRRMVEGGVAAEADRDAVEAELDALVARAAAQREEIRAAERIVALQRQDLDDLVIRAPFAGVAISKNAQPGEMISPISAGGGFTRTGISTIVDMASLEIEVDVNEAYIQRVSPGQRVRATLDAWPDAPMDARVITIIPAADRQKATVTVRIGFERLEPRILPDMGVKVAFLAEPAAPGAAARPLVRLPRAAVRGATGAEHVLVVGDDGRLERRAVPAGLGEGDRVSERRGEPTG